MIKGIVFSNNSPKLLEIFLKSVKTNNIHVFNFSVLYKSDDNSASEYLKVFEENNISSFRKEIEFKEDLLTLMNHGDEGLISFFKDTNYFFSAIPGTDFSMTLGKNTTHCYYNDVYNILLNEEENGTNTIKWNWVKHYLDFGRPLELGAGHTFHKKEITKLFKKWNYNSIQGLEESFDKLDYYPKEMMSSFKKSILVDVISKVENPSEELKSFDFSNLDRIIIEI